MCHQPHSDAAETHEPPTWPLSLPLRLLDGLILFYQQAISPWLGNHCRFSPTCSEYMRQALRLHGLAGVALGFWRILRCNPLCVGGHDPVPKPPTS